MTILIVGEFSGFAKYLKAGFVALGHECVVVTNSDGKKKIPFSEDDILFGPNKDVYVGKIRILGTHRLLSFFRASKLTKEIRNRVPSPDIVIVINYSFLYDFPYNIGVQRQLLEYYKNQGAKLVMTCCGTDPALVLNYQSQRLKYSEQIFPAGISASIIKKNRLFDWLIKISDIIVPTCYEYSFSIRQYCETNKYHHNVTRVTPLPMQDLPVVEDSCENRKVRILHGITRPQLKGSLYFTEALNRLQDAYPEKVEIYVVENIPFTKYVELFDKADILLDQTNSYGFGINAEIGLMKGKVVFSGNEDENERDMGLGPCPIINATPNVDNLYRQLEDLILNPHRIETIKKQSSLFARENLECSVVAKRYFNYLGY